MFELLETDLDEVTRIKKARKGGLVGMRADVLRLKHKGYSNAEVADLVEITPRTVSNILGYYRSGGLDKALNDDPRPGRPANFDDRVKSQIVAVVCSDPPEGFDRWTLDLITEEVINRKIVSSISREKIRIILHEHDLKPWQHAMWCIPELTEEFISRMETILDLYEIEHDGKVPLICLDEKPVPLRGHVRSPLPMTPGSVEKVDFEYSRHGSANVFFAFEPQQGVYWTKVTHKRKAEDFAEFLADLAAHYSDCPRINLVMDNLNIHFEKSLISRFGEKKGSAVWNHFNVFYTPKHGSWLNQAEIGLKMYSTQCLADTRISDIKTLSKRTKAWTRYMNEKAPTVTWSFNSGDARKSFGYI